MILELHDLTKVFSGRDKPTIRAVDGVSLAIPEGSTFGLVGESGSGKSTLARMIPRLIEPTSGELVHGLASGAALDERVREMIGLVGLQAEHANRFPHEFSGGQRQRIGIARALILNPQLLILDEPTSALDVSVQAQILNLLIELQNKLGLTYLLISHDLSIVRYMCDQVALMYLGAIVEKGSVAQVFDHPLHPYTQALLADVPSADPDQRMLDNVHLELDIFSAPWSGRGCRFSLRCPAAQIAACATHEPALIDDNGGQEVACHLVTPVGHNLKELVE
jgi:oligopeptide transport system ATP-binding protein